MALKALDNLLSFLDNPNVSATSNEGWDGIIGDRTAETMKTETAIKFHLDKKNTNVNKRLQYIQTIFASSGSDEKLDEKADEKSDPHSFFKPIESLLDISKRIGGSATENPKIKGVYELASEADMSLGCNFSVATSGKWYYEVELIEDPNTYKDVSIGYANDSYSARNEVGFDGGSYGYNGVKNKVFHMDTSYGSTKWKVGDIVGFALNGRNIEFYLNGVSQGIAFENIDCIGNLNAGFTLQRGQHGTFIFAEDKLKQAKPDGYSCLPVDIQADADDLWTLNGDITAESADNGFKIQANQGFPTAVLECAMGKDNKYYFEFELGTAGCMQLGFVDEKFEADDASGKGVGDDEHGWGCDFLRLQKWGIWGNKYGNACWKTGDVIGCVLDYDSKCISYSLNGKDIGVAFKDIDCCEPLFPCITIRNIEARGKLIEVYQKKRAGAGDEVKMPDPIVYANLIFCEEGYKYKPNGCKAVTEAVAFKAVDICNGLREYSYEQYKEDYAFMDSVIMLSDDGEFDEISKKVGDKLIVCDFWATWCGPCIYIAPHYHKISEQFPDVVFLKVDVDKLKKLSQEKGINCMPTFKFFKNGKEIHKIEGADKDAIIEAVKKYK